MTISSSIKIKDQNILKFYETEVASISVWTQLGKTLFEVFSYISSFTVIHLASFEGSLPEVIHLFFTE